MKLSKYSQAAIVICESLAGDILERLNKRCRRCQGSNWQGESMRVAEQIKAQLEVLSKATNVKAAMTAADCICTLARVVCDNEADTPSCAMELVMSKVYDELCD